MSGKVVLWSKRFDIKLVVPTSYMKLWTGPAGAPLPPLMPLLLGYFNHNCSLPYVIYYFIFDLICYLIKHPNFISYLLLVVGGGWWVVLGGGGWWKAPGGHERPQSQFLRTDFGPAFQIESSNNTTRTPTLVWGLILQTYFALLGPL